MKRLLVIVFVIFLGSYNFVQSFGLRESGLSSMLNSWVLNKVNAWHVGLLSSVVLSAYTLLEAFNEKERIRTKTDIEWGDLHDHLRQHKKVYNISQWNESEINYTDHFKAKFLAILDESNSFQLVHRLMVGGTPYTCYAPLAFGLLVHRIAQLSM